MIREFKNEFRWLSNFYPVKIILDGVQFQSIEHAYMSQKSDDIKWKNFCSNYNSKAGDVKKQSRTIKLKSNWDEIKLEVMKECIRQKFSQEPFRTKLLKTGNEHIQEGNMWNDKFWGVCLKTNKGENNLGKLIMDIRTSLKSSI